MDWEPIATKEPNEKTPSGVLPERILRVLKTIAFDHFSTQQEHARKMGIADSTFSKWAKELRQAGLITDEAIHKGTRGARVKILVPTDEGYEYLKKVKIAYKPIPGNGSLTHKY